MIELILIAFCILAILEPVFDIELPHWPSRYERDMKRIVDHARDQHQAITDVYISEMQRISDTASQDILRRK